MKIRRFIGKRRRKAVRRWQDQLAAKHVGAADRHELARFASYLRGALPPDAARAYVLGEDNAAGRDRSETAIVQR